jgi:hypothetical protein
MQMQETCLFILYEVSPSSLHSELAHSDKDSSVMLMMDSRFHFPGALYKSLPAYVPLA